MAIGIEEPNVSRPGRAVEVMLIGASSLLSRKTQSGPAIIKVTEDVSHMPT